MKNPRLALINVLEAKLSLGAALASLDYVEDTAATAAVALADRALSQAKSLLEKRMAPQPPLERV